MNKTICDEDFFDDNENFRRDFFDRKILSDEYIFFKKLLNDLLLCVEHAWNFAVVKFYYVLYYKFFESIIANTIKEVILCKCDIIFFESKFDFFIQIILKSIVLSLKFRKVFVENFKDVEHVHFYVVMFHLMHC